MQHAVEAARFMARCFGQLDRFGASLSAALVGRSSDARHEKWAIACVRLAYIAISRGFDSDPRTSRPIFSADQIGSRAVIQLSSNPCRNSNPTSRTPTKADFIPFAHRF